MDLIDGDALLLVRFKYSGKTKENMDKKKEIFVSTKFHFDETISLAGLVL